MDGRRISTEATARYALGHNHAEPELPRVASPRNTPGRQQSISLDRVRVGPRAQNEYVESPIPRLPVTNKAHHHNNNVQSGDSGPGRPGNCIKTQPNLKKHQPQDEDVECSNSIICPKCGRCRCRKCTQPREIPSKWFCNNKYECSTNCMVEYTSCVCFPKHVFYHCYKDGEIDNEAGGDPCACFSQPHCCSRWTCLLAMSFCLPCMCCYPLLKGGVAACTACYNCSQRRGCRCRKENKRQSANKGLLIDPESSSST